MRTSSDGISLIKHFEGFRAHPYQCQAKVWTIGYGHTKGVTATAASISMEEAERILQDDLAIYERAVMRLITAPLSQGKFDALVSFTFNLGGGALQRSTLRMKINRQEDAAHEFLKWVRAGGQVSRGLLLRRQAEIALFKKRTNDTAHAQA